MMRFILSSRRELHIDDLRTALINSLVARQRAEGCILYFDDMEQSNELPPRDQETQELLKKFAIHPERTLYRSENLHRTQQFAVKLVTKGEAFLCICTPQEWQASEQKKRVEEKSSACRGRCNEMSEDEIRRIQKEKIPYTIRIRKPLEAITFIDQIQAERYAEPSEVDHFVLLHSDGTPSEDFACACDDLLAGITLVVRPKEHLSPHSARQIHIRRALDCDLGIDYAHLPPLLDPEGRRFSPDDKRGCIRSLLEEGFLPDAIINDLLSSGIGDSKEIFTLPEALDSFDLSRLSSDPVSFDQERLRRINREHLLRMDDLALSRIFRFADADIGRLAKLYLREGAATIGELEAKISALFAPKACSKSEGEAMRTLSKLISEAPIFASFHQLAEYLSKQSSFTGDRLLTLLHRLITGSDEEGPELEKIYPTIKAYLPEVARCQP